jgi:hypothetical protein
MMLRGVDLMTSQTKHYIDLSDVMAVRCECKGCGAVLSLSLSKGIDARKLQRCPNCFDEWAESSGSTIQVAIQQAMDSFLVLQRAMESRKGFSMTLEVKPDSVRDKT